MLEGLTTNVSRIYKQVRNQNTVILHEMFEKFYTEPLYHYVEAL